jgi:hypothetical protein
MLILINENQIQIKFHFQNWNQFFNNWTHNQIPSFIYLWNYN